MLVYLFTGISTLSVIGLITVTVNFTIKEQDVNAAVNLPLAKYKDKDITEILELSKALNRSLIPTVEGEIKSFEDDRTMISHYHENFMNRIENRRLIKSLSNKVKILRIASVLNIVLSIIFAVYVFCGMIGACVNEENLSLFVTNNLKIYVALWLFPWIFFVVTHFWSRNLVNKLEKF
jgi:hypothetical protein